MEPDKYQQAWQAHSSQTRVTIDADVLLNAVQRNQRDLRAAIFWGEINAIGIALLLLPVWIYLGVTTGSPWTWYLMVPVLVWEIGFTLAYRMRHSDRPTEPGEPLLSCTTESLALVEQQIWLYGNFFWWNLLPTSIALLAFFAQVSWQAYEAVAKGWLEFVRLAGSFIFYFIFVFAFFYFVHYIIRRTVRTQYEPRRQELLALQTSLTDQTTYEVSGEFPILMGAKRVACSPRRMRAASLWFWAIMLPGIAGILIAFRLTAPIRDQLVGAISNSNYDGPSRSSGPAGNLLARLITDERKEKKLVSLAAMVLVDGQLQAAAADGERKIGSGVPVDIGDRWHLGGISKAITATMIARLIESGKMQWSDNVGKVFPEASVHDDWKPVTLRQLLTDIAGAPKNFPREVWRLRPALGRKCTEARREAVLNVIAGKPESPPGEKFTYSNVGYVIAASMAEKVTGDSWEDLVKRQVFDLLKLTESGFGPPASPDETLPQPRGHLTLLGSKVAEDDKADNTPIMGPSATIHMTLRNLCKFTNEHLRGYLGKGKLLSTESYKLLHAPELNRYACGWVRKESGKEIPYTVYWHNGSNTLWYALVVFIPEKKMVVAVTSNDGDFQKGEAAAWEIVKASANNWAMNAEAQTAEKVEVTR
jgi:CubicO group peptidase (beta-lactamase class C family)